MGRVRTGPKAQEASDNLAVRSKIHPARWHDKYPAAAKLEGDLEKETEEVLVVDIGGNHGHDLISFHKQNPHLSGRLVLQDLLYTLARIDPHLQGIETMAHDFFKPQPIRGETLHCHCILDGLSAGHS